MEDSMNAERANTPPKTARRLRIHQRNVKLSQCWSGCRLWGHCFVYRMKIFALQALLFLSSWQQLDAASSSVIASSQARPRLFENLQQRLRPAQAQKKRNEDEKILQVKLLTVNEDGISKVDNPIPLLLRPWVHLSRSLPLSFTIASALFLTGFDYSSAFIVRKALGWPYKESRIIAGSVTTIFHSIVLVIGLSICLWRAEHYKPSGLMKDHPVWWRDAATALIQFCTGYMLYDSCVQFIADRWIPGSGPVLKATDYMFLGHHAVTAFYMTSARLIQAGHMR